MIHHSVAVDAEFLSDLALNQSLTPEPLNIPCEASGGKLAPYVLLPAIGVLGLLLLLPPVTRLVGAIALAVAVGGLALLAIGLTVAGLALLTRPVGLRPRFIMLAFPLLLAVGTRLRGRSYVTVVSVSAVLLVAFSVYTVISNAVFP